MDLLAGKDCLNEYACPDKFIFQQCDVSDELAVQTLISKTVKDFNHINNVINNAGIPITKPVEKLCLDEWPRVIDTNLTSCFLTARYAAPHLKNSREPLLI